MTKPSPEVTRLSKSDLFALETAHCSISRYTRALFILVEIQLLPRIKTLKKIGQTWT